MNTLSLYLWAAEALPSVALLLGFVAWATAIVTAIYKLVLIVNNSERRDSYTKRNTPEVYEQANKFFTNKEYLPSGKLVTAIFLSGLLTAVIPSKETLYLIAGSEVGEMVLETPEAKEIAATIKEVVQSQLENLRVKQDAN